MGGAVPEVGTLRQTLADIRQQLEQKQLQLQNVARHGQEILSEEETLRRKLEEAQEADNQGDEVSPDTQMHTEHSRLSQVERIEWQNQNLAEELEEMERNLSNSPPRRRVRSEVLKTTEERLEHLRQELADLRHAEETQETRWQLEERNLSSELQEAKQQDEAMLKALADKLQSVNDKNRKLEEDLRLEEEKTQEKTSSLDAEVSRLRGSLWWFTTPATPSELWSGASSASSHRPDRPDRPSPRASPRASAVSVAVSGVSGCISQGTSRASASSSKRQSVHSLRSTSSKDSEPRARRRATRSAFQDFHRLLLISIGFILKHLETLFIHVYHSSFFVDLHRICGGQRHLVSGSAFYVAILTDTYFPTTDSANMCRCNADVIQRFSVQWRLQIIARHAIT